MNFKGWTEKQIKDLKEQGKIRDYTIHKPKEPETPEGRLVAKHFKKKHPQKDWMGRELLAWCQERGLVLKEELQFAPPRKFQFDWAVDGKGLKVAIEYEGLVSGKSRHTTITGYSKDTQKYNLAQSLGWTVLRFTILTYEETINELDKYATSMGK